MSAKLHPFNVVIAVILAAGLVFIARPAGPVRATAVSLAGLYSQNFNSLAASGTSNPWADDNTIPGWYAARYGGSSAPAGPITTYKADSGLLTTGAVYSYGTGAGNERALGSVGSYSEGGHYYGVRLINDTDFTITALNITYTGEQWRNAGYTVHHSLNFAYKIGTNLTSLITGTWISDDTFRFTGPIASDFSSSLDGNLPANRVQISGVLTENLPAGNEIMLRWDDPNDPEGNDHGLAIDDFAITGVILDEAPFVSTTSPGEGATGVPYGSDVAIEFSEPVSVVPESLFNILCNGVEQAGTVSGSDSSYTIDLIAALPYGAVCQVTVDATSVLDLDGITQDPMAEDYIFSFTTLLPDPAPGVIAVSPLANATGVTIDSNLTVEFSEPVIVADGWYALSCAVSGDHLALVSGGPGGFTLDPQSDFLRNELCVVTLESTLITDQDSNDPYDEMAEDYTWSFTTLSPDPAPSITGLLPLNNTSGVALDAPIGVTFSEPVALDPGWFQIACARSGIHVGSTEGDATQTSFVIQPVSVFYLDEACQVTVHQAAVHDLDSDDPPDGMVSDQVWSFSTLKPSFHVYLAMIMTLP